MARIAGVVSRSVPLDPVIGRQLTLTGTFEFFVSTSELVRITPLLDALIASGILTKHVRSIEDGQLIANATAPVVDTPNTSGTATPGPIQVIPFALPDGAATYTYTAAKTIEVVDMVIHKVGAGTGTTYQVQDGSSTAITDAVAVTADKGVGRMGTVDRTKNVISASATFKIVVAKSSGTSQAELYLYTLLR